MRCFIRALTASLAVPAGLAIALPMGSASAASAAPVIVTCATSAPLAAAIHVGTCSNKAITGGAGKVTANSTGTTFKVAWKSGKTTTGTSVPTLVTPSKCGSKFPTEVRLAATVKGGTAKALIGGKATNTLCANTTTGRARLLAGTKFKI